MNMGNLEFSIEFLSKNLYPNGYRIGTSLGLSEENKSGLYLYKDLYISIQNLKEEDLKINFILGKNDIFTLKAFKDCHPNMVFRVAPKRYAFCAVTSIIKTIKEGQKDRLTIVISTLANIIIKELNYDLVLLNPNLVSNYNPIRDSLRDPYVHTTAFASYFTNFINLSTIQNLQNAMHQLYARMGLNAPQDPTTLTSPDPERSDVEYSSTRDDFHRTFQTYNIPTKLIFPERQTNDSE